MMPRMHLVLSALALALFGGPFETDAQPATKPHRIGFLGNSTPALGAHLVEPFR